MTTPRELITGALRLINVVQANETPTDADVAIALEAMNAMLDSWSTERLSIYTMQPYFFPFIPGQKDYLLGPDADADWRIERPMDVVSGYVRYAHAAPPVPPPPPPPPVPTASFTASPLTGVAPLLVDFTDTSTDATSWQWDFTNDGITDSTAQNPSGIEYATPGTYSVKLTATNDSGSDENIRVGYIEVTAPPPPPPPAPTASFTANPVTGEAPLFVNFTDTSTDAPTSWQWDFTNDGITDSTSQNPSGIEYATPGTYSVKLIATNDNGSDENIRVDYIEVTAPPPPPPGGSADVDVVTSLLTYQTAYTNTLRDLSGNPLDNAVEIGTLVLDESQTNIVITGQNLDFSGLGSARCDPPVDVTSTSYCYEFYLNTAPATGLRLGVWSGGMFPFQPDEGNGGFSGIAATTIAPNGDWNGYSTSGSTGVTFGIGDVIGVLITNLYGVVWFKNGVRMNTDYADFLNGNDLTPLASMTE
jgi:PKD repeat protein